MKISVSFLKSKYNLYETIERIDNTDADFIHVDVMDGVFVPNICNSYNEVKNVLKCSKKNIDIHLMVDNPIEYIMDFKNTNPSIITIHAEINKNIDDLIDLIHSYGIKAGISIKPKTNVEDIIKYLSKIDNVLIMSVEPGMGGQKFLDSITYKIDILKKLRKDDNYNYQISIDGGINNDTVNKTNGVDIIVSGSYICESDDYQEKVNELKNVQ